MFRRWLLALIARFGLIGVGFCCCLLLLYLLACKPASNSKKPSLPWPEGTTSKEGYMALLQEREDSHRHYINSLTKQIAELKEALQERTQQLQESLDKAKAKGILPQGLESLQKATMQSDLKFFRLQLNQAEVTVGVSLPSEYAVIPFDMFTLQTVYQLETGLSKHPSERLVRKDRKDELISTVETALHILNGPQQHQEDTRRKHTYSPSDFIQGLTRTERTRGSTYELVFKGDSQQDFTQLLLFRPFGPAMKVKSESVNTRSTVINIIIPLSKRMEAFSRFMSNFRQVCIQQNSKVHLTIVYFGKDEVDQVKTVLDQTTRETQFRSFTLIQLKEAFSRGRGLEVGVRAWRRRQNVLLFFCDVDIIFTADFLTSCRINAEPGKKVFYPVLFSQYNPAVIYKNSTHLPPLQQQLVISQETGFWRDFGFGMTCQYRSDFINIGGFDRSIKGWGLEDVHLYRKYLHSKLMVIRSPSRGLFHLWHEKNCADELPPDKFKMCMQTKAMNEASHGQLGELFFRREKEPHRNK
uniref:Hexosyltransferase n=1 Tax=Oryzias latipes TaxID=8090 RepID=A0A3P9HTR2_ORYLA